VADLDSTIGCFQKQGDISAWVGLLEIAVECLHHLVQCGEHRNLTEEGRDRIGFFRPPGQLVLQRAVGEKRFNDFADSHQISLPAFNGIRRECQQHPTDRLAGMNNGTECHRLKHILPLFEGQAAFPTDWQAHGFRGGLRRRSRLAQDALHQPGGIQPVRRILMVQHLSRHRIPQHECGIRQSENPPHFIEHFRQPPGGPVHVTDNGAALIVESLPKTQLHRQLTDLLFRSLLPPFGFAPLPLEPAGEDSQPHDNESEDPGDHSGHGQYQREIVLFRHADSAS